MRKLVAMISFILFIVPKIHCKIVSSKFWTIRWIPSLSLLKKTWDLSVQIRHQKITHHAPVKDSFSCFKIQLLYLSHNKQAVFKIALVDWIQAALMEHSNHMEIGKQNMLWNNCYVFLTTAFSPIKCCYCHRWMNPNF